MRVRALGLAVVLIAVLTAMIVPLRAGHRIAGTARAIEMTPAPGIGNCVQAALPDDDSAHLSLTEVVACATWHTGEVVTTRIARPAAAGSRTGQDSRPNLAACATTSYAFMGVHPVDANGKRSPVLGAWWPAFAASFHILSAPAPQPTPPWLAAPWRACVLTGEHGPLRGHMAGVFGGAPQRNPAPLCLPRSTVVLHVSVRCDEPHPAEIVGWQVTDGAVDAAASFGPSCRALARRITGMPDPTAGGRLWIRVITVRSPDTAVREGWGPGHGGPYRAACTIGSASGRLLAGSLTGVGAARVPWAG
jgi:hypothetical protein